VPNPANPQTLNRYSYAGNNPLTYNDPDGHCFVFCVVIVVAASPWGQAAIWGGLGLVAMGLTIWMSENDMGGQIVEDAGNLVPKGLDEPDLSFGDHVKKDMAKRGWTEGEVKDVVKNPERVVPDQRDTRHNPQTGTRNDKPATAYVAKDGSYVVVNEDQNVVQVSDKNDPDWKAPWNESGNGGDGGGD